MAPASCTSCCWRLRSRSSRTVGSTTSFWRDKSCCSLPRRPVWASRATTCWCPGRRSLRCGTTCAVAFWQRGSPRMNRALDIAIAGTGLIVSSPLVALGALAVKLEDRGPVLYKQVRVGKDGGDFELLKLRTMIVGAEKQGAGYAVDKGDSRITKAGRVLRKL